MKALDSLMEDIMDACNGKLTPDEVQYIRENIVGFTLACLYDTRVQREVMEEK